jgi:23S rRNA (adenine2503-C2)-methyltransferase
MNSKTPLIRSLSTTRFRAVLEEFGLPAYQVPVMRRFLYRLGVTDFEAMTTLSTSARRDLAASWSADLPAIAERLVDPDGTVKTLFDWNGIRAESVLMPSKIGRTACLSVQSGCRLGCAFCATGRSGFRRDLSVGEILDQILVLSGEGEIARIVLMGMGEPLENLDEVIPALTFMVDEKGFGYSRKKITLSTVGIPEGLKRLAEEGPGVELAISLHAADDSVRNALIPLNRRHGINEILVAAAAYGKRANAKVTIEYMLIEDLNDTDKDAERLARMARQHMMPVNILRFNPVPGVELTPSRRVDDFARFLKGLRVRVTVRRSRGASIMAACGQLAGAAVR